MTYKPGSIAGVPLFFVLFVFTIVIWIIDIKNLNKYYNNSLIYFTLFGIYYVLISAVGGFSLLFNVYNDNNWGGYLACKL